MTQSNDQLTHYLNATSGNHVSLLTQHTPIPCKCKLSTPSCFAKAFTFKWCLKAAGNCECCFTANTSIVPACTCLSSIHTTLWKQQSFGANKLHQVTAHTAKHSRVQEISAQPLCRTRQWTHHILLTRSKLSISTYTDRLLVLTVWYGGH